MKPLMIGVAAAIPVLEPFAKTESTAIDDQVADRKPRPAAGMKTTMAYEREQGWVPEDVSGENHGFYVRSLGTRIK